MSILNFLKNGLKRGISLVRPKWFTRNLSKPILNSMSKEPTIPPEVMKYYQIRMLGKPFTEIDKKNRVWHGFELEGVKYYDKNPSIPYDRR